MTSLIARRIAEEPVRYAVTGGVASWLGEPPQEPLNESELSWIWGGQRYPAAPCRWWTGERCGW